MLGKITSIDQNNYPEMMGHTCIINAPGVFKVIWSILKPMLDPRTQAKIEARARAVPLAAAVPPALPSALCCFALGSGHGPRLSTRRLRAHASRATAASGAPRRQAARTRRCCPRTTRRRCWTGWSRAACRTTWAAPAARRCWTTRGPGRTRASWRTSRRRARAAAAPSTSARSPRARPLRPVRPGAPARARSASGRRAAAGPPLVRPAALQRRRSWAAP